jgi:hypothetical protein
MVRGPVRRGWANAEDVKTIRAINMAKIFITVLTVKGNRGQIFPVVFSKIRVFESLGRFFLSVLFRVLRVFGGYRPRCLISAAILPSEDNHESHERNPKLISLPFT